MNALATSYLAPDLLFVLFYAVFAFLSIWAVFWVIRLAVRYGMNDALRMNREWLSSHQEHEHR